MQTHIPKLCSYKTIDKRLFLYYNLIENKRSEQEFVFRGINMKNKTLTNSRVKIRISKSSQYSILLFKYYLGLHGNLLLGLLTGIIILSGVLVGSTMLSSSRSSAFDEHVSYKYYTSIQLTSGDTLWSIASKYKTKEYSSIQEYMEELRLLNGLSDDDIHAGQYLTISYYSYDFK